ncbi:DUF5107 domain-containing protein [Akkermansia sp. N21116]|uniref:DUF5107 domain-containing protein n=1 Tax=Akkermansia sp. N21116 TaxID=3040764 RepID=UPI00244EFA10|nr:DUF5107 domain-containing protein [Akkermansia sp. N21116]WPX40489.1 DUF5107 domain-containing protein [Akkermansia sp. N21116]
MEPITAYLIQSTVSTPGEVRAWEETIMLPTYQAGEEEKAPVFLEKRVYQGSSGSVYPYPVIESISDTKIDKAYRAFFLENEYVKIMILPELGGRVHMAYDKVKQRHFVYYNQVVKPALVGLTGPWISGGIEFNWPQHHRPSTFLPTEALVEKNADGSVTVWCNEVERMFRTKARQGFTLHPGRSYLEICVDVYNRTPFPQTFLWWANPAVVVNKYYQSVFPPDVHAVFDHGKRDVSSFPIATGTYYKQDYSAGVDISRYENIPVPTSYMAVKSKYDFVGGYQTDDEAGVLHVASHHVSPGKKQWTWGCGDFGKAWDRNLTDEDGPYIELMTGVYTDNQPDFSWLQPYEEKSWKQYFIPYSAVGYVKNATTEAIVNLEVRDGQARVIVYTTGRYSDLQLILEDAEGNVLATEIFDSSPEQTCDRTLPVGSIEEKDICLKLMAADGREILSYQPEPAEIHPVPDPAQAAKRPAEIASMEQLFLTGHHLEQYRHATYLPQDYYMEALKREPGDIRCNNAMGLLYLRKGRFDLAEGHFRKAIDTATQRNPNPYDGEPYYNLGWSLLMQDRCDEAYDAFYKATWNAAWQDPAYLAVARIDCRRANAPDGRNVRCWNNALEEVERSLIRNYHNHQARQLKCSILRKMGRIEEVMKWAKDSLKIDGFNLGCLFELYLSTGDVDTLSELQGLMRGNAHSYMEYACDYAAAGLYAEAEELLSMAIPESGEVYPMVYYMLGWLAARQGREADARAYCSKGEAMDPGRCFPNRIEEVLILKEAMRLNPSDARAPYYLGNFWYAMWQYDLARECWELSIELDAAFPTVLRNLALAYYNKYDLKAEAIALLEKAYSLDDQDSRILMELDQLYKKTGMSPDKRLNFLQQHRDVVDGRDDLVVELVTLLNLQGHHEEALDVISRRHFHPWEGGEGKITGQYVVAHVALAKAALNAGQAELALEHLNATDVYPENLGEGKLANAEENDINYYKGLALRALGYDEEASRFLMLATTGSNEPQQAFFYNDPQPDKIFYQGLAWRALGHEDKARGCFNKLVAYGEKHLYDECSIDYFAVSLPDLAIWEDDINCRNRIHCYYVMGLGYLGLEKQTETATCFDEVLSLSPSHQGVLIHRKILMN